MLRRICSAPPPYLEGNPENEELYTDVDRFHMQKDKIKFGGEAGGSSDSDNSVRFLEYFFCLVCRSSGVVNFTHSSLLTSPHNY